MPYPQSISFDNTTTDAIEVSLSLSINYQGKQCDDNCKAFISDNFDYILLQSNNIKSTLSDFRISLHPALDFPVIDYQIKNTISTLTLNFNNDSPNVFPELSIDVDESYILSATTDGISISCNTVYGARHAFETLNQLIRIYNKKTIIQYLPVSIEDHPRFKWRGLMVDPARNPLPLKIYNRIIDSLALMKMNVLHIRLSDSQFFPFQPESHPEVAQMGNFNSKRILTKDFLQQLSDYGAKRGVIVYPEIDFPAHVGALGLSHPEIVCNIYDYILNSELIEGENLIVLNPANDQTLNIVGDLINDASNAFHSQYVHVGGDEVQSQGWKNSKEAADVAQFMKNQKMSSYDQLEGYFDTFTQNQVLNNKKTPIVYQEVYEKGYADKNSILQIHYDSRITQQAVQDGYKVIISEGFDFDKQQPYCYPYAPERCEQVYMWVWTNRYFYTNQPYMDLTSEVEKGVLGGECSAYGQSIDEHNFYDVVFQRIGAIAERLWSSADVMNKDSHEVRGNYARCVGLRRGFLEGTGPLYHSICELPNEDSR